MIFGVHAITLLVRQLLLDTVLYLPLLIKDVRDCGDLVPGCQGRAGL